MTNKYMLDTSAINHIIEDDMKLEFIFKKMPIEFFVAHVQYDELMKMKENYKEKQEKAYNFLSSIRVVGTPTSVFCLGYSRLDQAQFGEGEFYKKVLSYMRDNEKRNKKKDHTVDCIIADTSHTNGMILITDDGGQYNAVRNYNGKVLYLEEFIEQINLI